MIIFLFFCSTAIYEERKRKIEGRGGEENVKEESPVKSRIQIVIVIVIQNRMKK